MRGETEGEREDVGAEGKKHRLPNTYSGFFILYLDPLQYSCLENPTDRGAQQATVHGVARVRHHLATKQPPPPPGKVSTWIILNNKQDLRACEVQLCATLCTAAGQASLSVGFCRQDCWSGLLSPPSEGLPNLGIKLVSHVYLHWPVGPLPLAPPGKPHERACFIFHHQFTFERFNVCELHFAKSQLHLSWQVLSKVS